MQIMLSIKSQIGDFISRAAKSSLSFVLLALGCFVAAFPMKGQELTSCIQLTPEAKYATHIAFKVGAYEYTRQNPPKWNVYRRDAYNIKYGFNSAYVNSATNVYHETLDWDEDAQ